MMVTFVSQCEKKSLAKTRRVLDAFANRIGSRTWQTVIIELVKNYLVTFYDAAYHALDIHRGGVFVTVDEKYIHKASLAGHILHLKNWEYSEF